MIFIIAPLLSDLVLILLDNYMISSETLQCFLQIQPGNAEPIVAPQSKGNDSILQFFKILNLYQLIYL